MRRDHDGGRPAEHPAGRRSTPWKEAGLTRAQWRRRDREDELYELRGDAEFAQRDDPERFPALADFEPRSEMSVTSSRGLSCKVEGCPNTASATRGRYAYLCDVHKMLQKGETAEEVVDVNGDTYVLADIGEAIVEQLEDDVDFELAVKRLRIARSGVLQAHGHLSEAREELREAHDRLAEVLPDWTGNE